MEINKITAGKIPEEINVVIEVPMRSDPVKYEFDKDSNFLIVDRFIPTSMVYPCNYGFIPHTLADDGDPVDVLVVSEMPILSGAVVRVRPVSMLVSEDESGMDEKVLAVPVSKVSSFYNNIKSYKDFPEIFLQRIEHFFQQYKSLEKNKWVKIHGWRDYEETCDLIKRSVTLNK